MGFKEAQVVFDRPDRTYAPGELVQGRLYFQQDKVKIFRGIYVKAKGFCTTHWTTSHTRRVGGRTQRYTKHHRGHETYFKGVVYFVGGESGECTLSPGEYSFPFQILLPLDCPSSFEATYGHIRYELSFVVDRAYKIDQQRMERINVVRTCDPNVEPCCRHPMSIEMSKSYYTLFVNRGEVQASVTVAKAGFCRGEVIPIQVTCENNSKLKLGKIKFQIKEITTFRATDDTKHIHRVITKDHRGPLLKNSSNEWDIELLVPSDMALYNVDRCQWININYELVITISSPKFHYNLQESRKIIIGHIPLIIPDGTDTNFMHKQTGPYLAICPSAPPDFGNPPSYNGQLDNMAAGSSHFKSGLDNPEASGSAEKLPIGFGESSYTREHLGEHNGGHIAPFPPPPYTHHCLDAAASAPEPATPDIDSENPTKY